MSSTRATHIIYEASNFVFLFFGLPSISKSWAAFLENQGSIVALLSVSLIT